MLSYNNKREGLNASAPHCMYLVISSQTLILKYALKNLFSIFPEAQHWQRTGSLWAHPVSCQSMQAVMSAKKRREEEGEIQRSLPLLYRKNKVLCSALQEKKKRKGICFIVNTQFLNNYFMSLISRNFDCRSQLRAEKNPPNRMKRVEIGRQNAPDTDI